jgi:hypothetical protein
MLCFMIDVATLDYNAVRACSDSHITKITLTAERFSAFLGPPMAAPAMWRILMKQGGLCNESEKRDPACD